MATGRLRITGGVWRGRRLVSVAGTRPTQERVRESLLSRWQPRLAGATLLELFCGSGVVGLEALSRGARRVVLVDRSPQATGAVAANCRTLGVAAARYVQADWRRATAQLLREGERFDLVFADPPYDFGDYAALLTAVTPLLEPGGELVLEHASREPVPEAVAGLELVETRRYGDATASIFSPVTATVSSASSTGAAGSS